jgi:hypothetical protein
VIQKEIFDAIQDAKCAGGRLNEIADQFRGGRNVDDIIALLDSADAELNSLGAWILGELHFELYDFDRFISRLRKLIDHDDPAVRFHAFGALFPALRREDASTHELLARLRNDPNEGVRKSAEAAAVRLSST